LIYSIYSISLHDALPIFKGSGRSVDSVNLYEVLNENRELFVSFGGHHAAVGVSLKEENISELKTKINHYMRDNKIEVKNNLQVEDRKSTRLNSSHVSISY